MGGSFKTFDGNHPRAEHFILKLDSNLNSSTSFGAPYHPNRGIYIPATPAFGGGSSWLNNRPISTATNLPVMHIADGAIYVLGLHVDQTAVTSSPTSLGYKLIKFMTNANSLGAAATQEFPLGTACNVAAPPALAVIRDDLLIAGCSQSSGPGWSNVLIREHSPDTLSSLSRIGTPSNDYALYTEGVDPLNSHGPSLNLYYDEERNGNFLYRGFIASSYPTLIRTWQK